MPTHTLIRIAAVLMTGALVWATGGRSTLFGILVFTVGFSHYFMALLFSRPSAARALSQPSSRVAMLGLVIGGAALYLARIPLVLYFAIHHAFNEVYMLDRTVRPTALIELRRLRTAAVALHGFAYLFVLRQQLHLPWLVAVVVLVSLFASIAAFGVLLHRARPGLSRTELIDNASGEILALLLVALSFVVRFTFLQIVAYHFFFWFLYPIPRLIQSDASASYRYVGLTAALLLAVFLFSPLGIADYNPLGSPFATQFTFWSHVHITLSFALSSANPGWVLRWFQPPAAVTGLVSRI